MGLGFGFGVERPRHETAGDAAASWIKTKVRGDWGRGSGVGEFGNSDFISLEVRVFGFGDWGAGGGQERDLVGEGAGD